MQAVAAMAIPPCLSTILIALIETFQMAYSDFTAIGLFLGVITISTICGFAIIVRAFQGRRLMLAGLAALYFPFWCSVLPLYWLVLSAAVANYWCTDPRGGCWP